MTQLTLYQIGDTMSTTTTPKRSAKTAVPRPGAYEKSVRDHATGRVERVQYFGKYGIDAKTAAKIRKKVHGANKAKTSRSTAKPAMASAAAVPALTIRNVDTDESSHWIPNDQLPIVLTALKMLRECEQKHLSDAITEIDAIDAALKSLSPAT